MQAITIAAGGGVWRNLQQTADVLERVLMPDFQHDDFTLIHGQSGQAAHGFVLQDAFALGSFKPPAGFQFAGEPAPQRPPVIQGSVPKTANQVMLRLLGPIRHFHQGHKGFLQDVLGLGVPKSQRAAVEHQLCGLPVIQLFHPVVHVFMG